MTHRYFVAMMLASASASGLAAQSIADRVSRAGDGTVRMSFATRPEVCGRGRSIQHGPSSRTGWFGDNDRNRDVEFDAACDYGPGRLVLDKRDGEIVSLRFYVGGRWRPADSGVTDLGTVGAKEAADYLVSLASTLPGKAGREAIFPATLADSAEVWPALIRIARDEERPRETRKQAVFWLGQAAGEAATAGLDSLSRDSGVDRDVQKQVVFALSQRPRDEGIPVLIRVARTHRDPAVRRDAVFWLGQSNDPRAIALFEELLLTKK
jgi:HEAT repeat protein